MQPDGVFVEFAAGVQIHHVKHDMAAPDDIERRIEDVLRHGHAMSLMRRRKDCDHHSGMGCALAVSCSWILLRFQLVSLSLICMSKDSANLLCAKTGSRWSDRMRKICSPAFLRVARSRPSPSRSTMSRKPNCGLPSAMAKCSQRIARTRMPPSGKIPVSTAALRTTSTTLPISTRDSRLAEYSMVKCGMSGSLLCAAYQAK